MKKTIITGLFLLSSLESAFSSGPIGTHEEDGRPSISQSTLNPNDPSFTSESMPRVFITNSDVEREEALIEEEDSLTLEDMLSETNPEIVYTLDNILLNQTCTFESIANDNGFGQLDCVNIWKSDGKSDKFPPTTMLELFPNETMSFKDCKSVIDRDILGRINSFHYSSIINFCNYLRHLTVSTEGKSVKTGKKKKTTITESKRNPHGDYISEYILIEFIKGLESISPKRNCHHKYLWHAYDGLRRVYSHMLFGYNDKKNYNSILWGKDNRGKVPLAKKIFIDIPDKEEVELKFSFFEKKKNHHESK